ncbi:MAG: tetratricopeptide repeat protein [Treponema sp.]|jgi:Ca-activated chloride channel family protein|nr:tetratricopeptide repeat protein [Treponema sp.]
MKFVLVLILLNSCSRIAGELAIMEANFFYSRGETDKAIAAYMHSLDYPEAVPYAEFGLGVVYLSLEEKSAAFDRFMAAEQAARDDQQLLYRIRYNTGIIRFEQGDFEGAISDFSEALVYDGSSREAKRNLELSLLSQTYVTQTSTAEEQDPESITRTTVLFDYLREKEREQWRSQEWNGESSQTEPDY